MIISWASRSNVHSCTSDIFYTIIALCTSFWMFADFLSRVINLKHSQEGYLGILVHTLINIWWLIFFFSYLTRILFTHIWRCYTCQGFSKIVCCQNAQCGNLASPNIPLHHASWSPGAFSLRRIPVEDDCLFLDEHLHLHLHLGIMHAKAGENRRRAKGVFQIVDIKENYRSDTKI